MAFTLKSPHFVHEHSIPERHTCVGSDEAPALEWSGAPAGTVSFALVVDDPDAPDPSAPQRVFVHWIVYNLPASARALPLGGALPHGATAGENDFGNEGYNGPCPPVGRHRYYFRLHALDIVLPPLGSVNRSTLETAMAGHLLASATLMGTFEKPRRGKRKK
jgi:Raf kinase inhibitor-like YbhB/YbcL family protein